MNRTFLKISFPVVVLAVFLFIFPFFFSRVFAESEFSTSYEVNYDIGTDGSTQVTQKISLKNLTSQYYASNFTLSIGSTTVTGVSAIDGSGPMETKVEAKDNKTNINVKFNQQVAGVDKVQTFTLKFTSKDFAQSLGKTWEVNLPRIPESTNISLYNLTVSVPVSFGDPTSIAPVPKSESSSYDRLSFHFTKEQLGKSGISINFGSNQVFDFNLKYHLDNTSLFPVLTSITLPPDTQYQDVLISRISPEPINVTIDEDGNYLAWFKLDKRGSEDIAVSGSAKLYIKSKNKNKITLAANQIKDWTKSDQYWEKDNPAIVATLAEIFKDGTPKTNRDKARLIYNYIVGILKYDTSRINDKNIERLGAVTVLNNRENAVCMEFTDLFIALVRAADVPARELDGFAYSQNKNLRPLSLSQDLLHAWPEYYDENNGWVMVDPTWENTSGGADYFNKFDLNHLVLAVRGISSKFPYTSDDVKVSISSNDFLGNPQPDIAVDIPEGFWAGFPATISVKISNQGNTILAPTPLSLVSKQIDVLGENAVILNSIPPYGNIDYKFNIKAPFVWQPFEENLEINVGGKKMVKAVEIKPFFLFYPFPYIFLGVVALILGTYISILTLHIFQKKSA